MTLGSLGARRTYRSAPIRWAAGACTAAAVALTVLGGQHAGGRVGALAGAAVLLTVAWRLWSVGIQVGPPGVRIVSATRSRLVPWGDIAHFAAMPKGPSPYAVHVVVRGGRRYGSLGLATPPWASGKSRLRIHESIDTLDRMLSGWRQANRDRTEDAREGAEVQLPLRPALPVAAAPGEARAA